jgi:homoserine dehydrogenase
MQCTCSAHARALHMHCACTAHALRAAQAAGIAEADPEGDLSGMDAAVKVVALVNSLEMGVPLLLSDVAVEVRGRLESRAWCGPGVVRGVLNRVPKDSARGDSFPDMIQPERTPYPVCIDVQGVRGITPERVAAAKAAGRSLRLVGGAELREGGEGGITAYVRPEELEPGDPLHGLAGSDAALTFYTDRLAPVTITQKGSTVEDTAFGAFADVLRACRPEAV